MDGRLRQAGIQNFIMLGDYDETCSYVFHSWCILPMLTLNLSGIDDKSSDIIKTLLPDWIYSFGLYLPYSNVRWMQCADCPWVAFRKSHFMLALGRERFYSGVDNSQWEAFWRCLNVQAFPISVLFPTKSNFISSLVPLPCELFTF